MLIFLASILAVSRQQLAILKVSWSCIEDCGDATFTIERKLCNGTEWVEVVTGYEGTS